MVCPRGQLCLSAWRMAILRIMMHVSRTEPPNVSQAMAIKRRPLRQHFLLSSECFLASVALATTILFPTAWSIKVGCSGCEITEFTQASWPAQNIGSTTSAGRSLRPTISSVFSKRDLRPASLAMMFCTYCMRSCGEWCVARACKSWHGHHTGPSCAYDTSGNERLGMSSTPARTRQHAGSGAVVGWVQDRATIGQRGTPTPNQRSEIGGAPGCARCCRWTGDQTRPCSSSAWSWTRCQWPTPRGWTGGSCLRRWGRPGWRVDASAQTRRSGR